MDKTTILCKCSIVILIGVLFAWCSGAWSLPPLSRSSAAPAPDGSFTGPAVSNMPWYVRARQPPETNQVPRIGWPLPNVDVRDYERLYAEVLKQKKSKEGLTVNINAETKKSVAAFRKASVEEQIKKLEDIKAKAKLYGVE